MKINCGSLDNFLQSFPGVSLQWPMLSTQNRSFPVTSFYGLDGISKLYFAIRGSPNLKMQLAILYPKSTLDHFTRTVKV